MGCCCTNGWKQKDDDTGKAKVQSKREEEPPQVELSAETHLHDLFEEGLSGLAENRVSFGVVDEARGRDEDVTRRLSSPASESSM